MKWETETPAPGLTLHVSRNPLGYYRVRNDNGEGVSCGFFPLNMKWGMSRYNIYTDAEAAKNACEKHWKDLCSKIDEYNKTL
jgi:hypothetical protein